MSIVAYLTLFAGTAFALVFVALWLGRFLRPHNPNPTKLEPYECGEPPIGSAAVQFDLRFYVVALVFIIFEVEVAFFFPWADVYGKLTRLAMPGATSEAASRYQALLPAGSEEAVMLKHNLQETQGAAPADAIPHDALGSLALAAMADMAVFFGVLLVGFAYLWRRGDLNWVLASRPTELAAAARLQRQGDRAA